MVYHYHHVPLQPVIIFHEYYAMRTKDKMVNLHIIITEKGREWVKVYIPLNVIHKIINVSEDSRFYPFDKWNGRNT